jgi:hypothetical protein
MKDFKLSVLRTGHLYLQKIFLVLSQLQTANVAYFQRKIKLSGWLTVEIIPDD